MWAVRRLFEHLARERPLIVGFDDLQWAEPTLLELIEYVVGWSREAPILIVCLARPDLLDRHPDLALAGRVGHAGPALAPEAEELLEHLRGEVEVEPALLSRITEAAEGNPLFVEQLLAMITENGAARGRPRDPAVDPRPARRAPRPARARGARRDRVGVGRRQGVLARRGRRADGRRRARPVGASLMTLARKEFIEPARSIFPSEDGFRFRHILIRDAAYLGVPKETRARPARAVRRLARANDGRAGERAGRDHRLPPRAGLSVPRGARARRRGRPRSSRRGQASAWPRRAAGRSPREATSPPQRA